MNPSGDGLHPAEVGGGTRSGRTIDLAAVEAVISDDPNLEDWQRDQLLTNARSVAAFLTSREPALRED